MAIGRPIEQTPNIADKVVTATATAGQTEFTVTGGYRINHLAVFRNGVRLVNGNDFTALDGVTVTLMEDAENLDVLEFQVFDTFNVSDALLTNAASQVVNGDVTVNGTFTVGSGGIGTFTAAEVVVGIVSSTTGITTVQSLQASSSTTTGALVVKGGVGIGKSLYVGGNVSVGGTLTYEDVTNVDSVGVVTAGKGVRITTGGLVVTAGVSTFAGITTVTNTAALHSKQLNVSAGSTFGGAITASDTLAVSGATTLSSTLAVTGTTTLSGDLSIADKIIHTGDTNTAIRFPSADTITAEIGGSEALRVDSSGRVLIGTTTEGHGDADNLTINDTRAGITLRSANDNTGNIYFSDGTSGTAEYKGYVQYSHTSNYLLFGTNATDRVQIDASGRVNIGNLSQRTVWGGNTALQIEGLTGATAAASIVRNSDDASYPWLGLGKSRGTSDGSSTIVQNNDCLGVISWNAADGNDMTSQGAAIYCDIDGTPGADDTPGRLEFHTCPDGSSTAVERLRINSNGQISIRGTTTAFDTTGDLDSLQLYYETDSGQATVGPYSSGGSTHLSFYTNASGAAATEKLRIQSTGELIQYGSVGMADGSADDLVIGDLTGSVNRGMTIYSHNAQNGSIAFADNDSNFRGAIQYLHNGDRFRILTGGQETFRVQSGGTDGVCTFFMGGITNNQNKNGALTLNHYTYNTYNQIDLIRGTSTSGVNKIEIGGSDSSNGSSAATSIQLYTAANATTNNGTERFRVTSDGTIHVNSSDSASGGRLYATGSAMYVQSGNGRQTFKVSDAASGVNRTIEMTSDGHLAFPSGCGIDFSATGNSNATTSSEVFHDYEEGTWTPTLAAGYTSISYNTQSGTYTKIGNRVMWTMVLYIQSASGAAAGVSIGGLPFPTTNTSNNNNGAYATYFNGTLSVESGFSDKDNATWYQSTNSSTIEIYKQHNGANIYGNDTSLGTGGNNMYFIVQGSYKTDA